MTISTLTTAAIEESTYVVTCAFANEDGDAVTPNSANWSLYDTKGNAINSRSGVSISPLSTSVDVVLQGDDLPYTHDGTLIFVVAGLYNSSLGNDLAFREPANITLQNVPGVT